MHVGVSGGGQGRSAAQEGDPGGEGTGAPEASEKGRSFPHGSYFGRKALCILLGPDEPEVKSRYQRPSVPMSIGIWAPVMYMLSSEARNATMCDTYSGSMDM